MSRAVTRDPKKTERQARNMARKNWRKDESSSREGTIKRMWRPRPGGWIIASLVGAALPFLLYFVYAGFPEARPWIALGNDGPIRPAIDEKGKIVVPFFGFPVQGAYLSLFLSAVIAYWGMGLLLSLRKAASAEGTGKETHTVPIPALSVLLFTLPTIAATWALTLKADVSPDFQWEVFGEPGGASQNLIILRRILSFALLLPQVSAALCVMSLVTRPSRPAIILGCVAIAVFVAMALWLNWMGG